MSRPQVVAVTVLLVVLSLTWPAAAGPQQVWEHEVTANASPCGLEAVSSAVDTSTGAVFSAFHQFACGPSAPLLVGYSRGGAHKWTYEATASDDLPVAVAVDPDSHRVLLATTRNGDDLLVQAFNGSTGALVWGRGFIAGGTANLQTTGLALGADGQVIAVGTVTRSGVPSVTLVSLRISNGTTRWHVHYDHNGDSAGATAYGVAADPAKNRAYLLGSTSSGSGENPVTVAYDTRTGNVDWAKGVSTISAIPTSVVVDTSNHQIYSVSSNRNTAEADTYAYSSSGAQQWHASYGTDGFEPYGAAVDNSNHRLYIAGNNDSAFLTTLVAYSSGGSRQWSDADAGAHQARPVGLAVDTTNHRVYVTSTSGATTETTKGVTFADSAAGARAWRSVYAPSGHIAFPGALAVDRAGGQVDVALYQDLARGGEARAATVAYTA